MLLTLEIPHDYTGMFIENASRVDLPVTDFQAPLEAGDTAMLTLVT
jgi:hypothetical protein